MCFLEHRRWLADFRYCTEVLEDNRARSNGQDTAGDCPGIGRTGTCSRCAGAYIDVPEHPGNKVIAMHFDGWVWGEHPHTFHGCPYFKVESTTKVMPQDMYDERIRAHQPQLYAWERLAADGVALADLDENLIRNSIRRGIDGGRIPESALYESTGDILSKWKLLKNGVPTNGAVLLFSNNIDEYPQFTLRMARFVGTNKNMFRDINVLKVISSNC